MASRNFWFIECGGIVKGTIDFKWEPGISIAQKRKSCENLHAAIDFYCGLRAMDISSASTTELGVKLSAFNLKLNGRTVECLYQGSKVYENTGAMHHLYDMSSLEAKQSMKYKNAGRLIGFDYFGESFPLVPRTAFYDYIYIKALIENYGYSLDVGNCNCFTDVQAVTDIDACQARSVCEYVLMREQAMLGVVDNFNEFLNWHKEYVEECVTVDTVGDEWLKHVQDNVYKVLPENKEKFDNLIKYSGCQARHLGYASYQVEECPSMVLNKDWVVVYSDLLLDDLCALEELGRRYKNIYLIAVMFNDLPSSPYASKRVRCLADIEEYLNKWFGKAVIATSPLVKNGHTVNGADCFLLCNATHIAVDLEAGIVFNNIVGMIGNDSTFRDDDDEWNASQDIKSYQILRSYIMTQVTKGKCEELYDKNCYYGGDYEFLAEYVEKMTRIKDSAACYDLQAVMYDKIIRGQPP